MKNLILCLIVLFCSLDVITSEATIQSELRTKQLEDLRDKKRQKRLQSRKSLFYRLEGDRSVKPVLSTAQDAWGKLGRLVKVLERCCGKGHYLYSAIETFKIEYIKSNSMSASDFLQKCDRYNKMMEEVLLQKFQEERDNRDYQKNRQAYLKLVDEKIINHINSSKKK